MTTRNALPMDPEKLVEGVTGLITLPEAALEVNRLADDPKSTAEDIARVVSRDPVLATQLLRIVNSASYGLMRRVDTITRAVTLFGTGQIRDLAIGLSVARSFNGIPSELITPQSFWNHSLLTALSAQMVAKQCIPGRGEVVFVAGLLHDIGRLVLFNREPERSYEALLMSIDMPGEPELWRCEREVFGTDHAAVGAALGRRWHLPARCCSQRLCMRRSALRHSRVT